MIEDRELGPEEHERVLYKTLKLEGHSNQDISIFYKTNIESDIADEFAQCQDWGSCACRKNNFITGFADKKHSDMANEPKYTKNGFESCDRSY